MVLDYVSKSQEMSPDTTCFCRRPSFCAAQAQRLFREQAKGLQRMTQLHERFLLHDPHSITASDHAVQRLGERGFSYGEVLGIIECCEPICFDDEMPSLRALQEEWGAENKYLSKLMPYKLLVKGEADDGRPVHVWCGLAKEPEPGTYWEMNILTVYDPSLKSGHQWENDYTRRTCFCPSSPHAHNTPQFIRPYARNLLKKKQNAARSSNVVYSIG